MADDAFSSSDSVRSGKPLTHAQEVTFDEPLPLEHGGQLPYVTVAYETYGRLNDRRDNGILICHAISGDSHVARHGPEDDPGWWETLVGPGKAIDTDRWFVVCSNVLGGCRGTTGPGSLNPLTGNVWGTHFPLITVGDMVTLQRRLQQHLQIDRWLAVVGGSLGGHQAMTWAVNYPAAVRGCVPIATSPRLTSQALAFDIVARNAILRDPDFRGGRYYDQSTGPDAGLAIARMLGHITYLSPEAMGRKFDIDRHRPRDVQTEFEKRFSVGSYLAYQGDRFVERFDANSYLTISLAMDMFDLGYTAEELRANLARARCAWQLISFSSDWLFTPAQSRQIVDALIYNNHTVSYCELPSESGHDGFLLAHEASRFGPIVHAFLRHQESRDSDTEVTPAFPQPASPESAAEEPACAATSIYHGSRLDRETILSLIDPGSSVLDLGCGPGTLLGELKRRGHATVLGLEVDEELLVASAREGVPVVDHDLNTGLAPFRDNQFDYVVLSQTIQAVVNTERVLAEMLRVGRRAIICFPNFAHHALRRMLYFHGTIPKMPGAFSYEWYDTPNRRFPTILDVDRYCHTQGITVERAVYLDTERNTTVVESPNWYADTAIYVLQRDLP